MRASVTKDGLTVRVIAGTHNVILGIDLEEGRRRGCLGFSIQRTTLGDVAASRWLPNWLRFPSARSEDSITTESAPLQKFRWGDYTVEPGQKYRYRVVARYGVPGALTPDLADPAAGTAVEVTTEDPRRPETAVFFNRAAAASEAFGREFPHFNVNIGDSDASLDMDTLPSTDQDALKWLSRGLDDALLAFFAQATNSTYALHAAVYEFQKPNLLQGLKDARDRMAEVQVVYHYRHKAKAKPERHPEDPAPAADDDGSEQGQGKDDTWQKNKAAAEKAGLTDVCVQRMANPQGAIMHNKFVVLLKKNAQGAFEPQAVWTGSTNWTDGGIYGQLNVGHAVYDPSVAQVYEEYFQILRKDPNAEDMKNAVAQLGQVPNAPIPSAGTLPILSPQHSDDMLHLYAAICENAKCLFVCAPFELDDAIRSTFRKRAPGTLRFLLLDKSSSLGEDAKVSAVVNDMGNEISIATTLPSSLHDFQGNLLASPEHFHHKGIHIHSKIILADPFGTDPLLVTGSANFSKGSTLHNDSNSLLIRGNTAVADIYATEFMRMFEHYRFRGHEQKAKDDAEKAGKKYEAVPLSLDESDHWSDPYYQAGSDKALERQMFAGTAP